MRTKEAEVSTVLKAGLTLTHLGLGYTRSAKLNNNRCLRRNNASAADELARLLIALVHAQLGLLLAQAYVIIES